jgi:hypothetical protein
MNAAISPDAVVRIGADQIEHFDDGSYDPPTTETIISEIFSEYLLCRWLNEAEIDRFAQNGVQDSSLTFDPAGGHFKLAAAEVVLLSGGRFEFSYYCSHDEQFITALIIILRDQFGDVADIAAWVPATNQIATWLNRVAMIGEHIVLSPRVGEPLRVYPTPMEWLRGCRQGIVILNPFLARPLLYAASPLGVDDVEFGKRLRETLTAAPPRILVARECIVGRAA